MIKLSVIIAVYNAEDYINVCLTSIQSQTLKNIEILCIDDCSTDDSLSILKSIKKEDNRIRLFQNQENLGAGPSRNLGLENATGDFICFMDPDDLYVSNTCLESLYNAVIENNVDAAAGNLLEFYGDDFTKAKDWGKCTFTGNGINTYSDYPFSIGYTRFIFRRLTIEKIGAKFPSYRRYQDPVWFVSVMTKIKNFYALNTPVYLYRKNYSTIKWTLGKIDSVLKGKAENLKIFRENNYPNHYVREKRELNNFIAMVIFKTFFSLNFIPTLTVIKKHNDSSQDIDYGLKKIFHLLKYGLILIKMKISKVVSF